MLPAKKTEYELLDAGSQKMIELTGILMLLKTTPEVDAAVRVLCEFFQKRCREEFDKLINELERRKDFTDGTQN